MTQRQLVLGYLECYPGKSAYQIARAIDANTSSISSLVKRLCDKGILRREEKKGPRKGYGYFLNANRS